MIVYVAEKGCYEDTYVAGVYSTLEKAMAAYPTSVGGWQKEGRRWNNDLDLDKYVVVEEYEVDA